MSLEDPESIKSTQPVPVVAPVATNGMRLRLPHLRGFKVPTITFDAEDPDASLREKLITRGARLARLVLLNAPRVTAALVVFFTVLWVGQYVFGYGQTNTVVETARRLYPPTSPLAYKWLDEQADATVAQHVIDARVNKQLGLLVLVASTKDDSAPATDVPCKKMFSTNDAVQNYYASLMEDAEQFLVTANHTLCVCAPQLGRSVRYMAFRADTGTTRGSSSLDEEGGKVLHLFNPVDSAMDAYDSLDDSQLASLGVGLKVAVESQDYRYNRARGSYSLLRRTKLSIVGVDRACHRERIGLFDQLAVAAEECLDLLRGIDVRERANRQAKLGVILNLPPVPTKPRGLKEEL